MMIEKQMYQNLLKRKPNILGEDTFYHYAILLPMIKKNGEIHILFEVRAYHLRRQPGEICFPGGKVDEHDTSYMEAAIRETCEELQVTKDVIHDVFPLDYIVSPNGGIFHLFAGTLSQNDHEIKPNQEEVAEIFTVPLSYFQTTKPKSYKVHLIPKPASDFPLELIPGGKNYKWQIQGINELFYEYKGRTIWGLTAKIVHHFIHLLQEMDLLKS